MNTAQRGRIAKKEINLIHQFIKQNLNNNKLINNKKKKKTSSRELVRWPTRLWFWFFVLNRRATEWFVFVWCWRQWQLHFAWQAQLADRSSLLSSSRVSFYFVPFIFFCCFLFFSFFFLLLLLFSNCVPRRKATHQSLSLSAKHRCRYQRRIGAKVRKKKNGDDQFEMKENVHQTRFPPYFDLDSKK